MYFQIKIKFEYKNTYLMECTEIENIIVEETYFNSLQFDNVSEKSEL